MDAMVSRRSIAGSIFFILPGRSQRPDQVHEISKRVETLRDRRGSACRIICRSGPKARGGAHLAEPEILSESVFLLCFGACSLCAVLFLRSWLRVRFPLLLWCALGFTFLAASNGLLLLDKVSVPDTDLSGYRLVAAFIGVGLLIYGLRREIR